MRFTLLLIALTVNILLTAKLNADDAKNPKKPATEYGKNLDKVDVTPKEWLSTNARRLTPSDIDSLLIKLQSQEGLQFATRTTDEAFTRRVYLDLVGKLPEPADIKSFIDDKSSNKRSELIDRLLASNDFNKHWAKYWRDVVTMRATEVRSRANEPKFEAWLADAMRKNTPWKTMVTEMITANGIVRYGPPSSTSNANRDKDDGAGYFLLTHLGAEANMERAADTARVFMGIQIQCAQCHDHPNDIWKREQFHQLAAFYARTKDRPVREENRVVGFTIFSALVGEYRMPDKDDPKKTYLVQPKFLTGESPKRDLSDEARRATLAQYVTSENNYWFHASMVNRVWADLMGQSFYNPVDNMGPLMEATYPEVLLKLAQHFKTTGTDIRDLYRVILNSETYQRATRLGEAANQHIHFAGNYPAKLTADELWASVNAVLGGTTPIQQRPFAAGKAGGPAERLARRFGFEGQFRAIFGFDPNIKQDEIESTITQALFLMNNIAFQGRMRATGDTTLGKILRTHTSDKEAVQAVYLRVLARTPTSREEKVSLEYIRKLGKRQEAFEDLFWALMNSAEFQTKR